MWVFLLSDGFSFGALLLAVGVLRAAAPTWRGAGEPAFGVVATGALTAVLLASSATCALAHRAAEARRDREAAALLGLTAGLGALFLLGQYREWFGLGEPGLLAQGLLFGGSARASTFYVVTGFHGLHVAVGVAWLLGAAVAAARRGARPARLELLGLYWGFVDLVWVFVFSFLYLMP